MRKLHPESMAFGVFFIIEPPGDIVGNDLRVVPQQQVWVSNYLRRMREIVDFGPSRPKIHRNGTQAVPYIR